MANNSMLAGGAAIKPAPLWYVTVPVSGVCDVTLILYATKLEVKLLVHGADEETQVIDDPAFKAFLANARAIYSRLTDGSQEPIWWMTVEFSNGKVRLALQADGTFNFMPIVDTVPDELPTLCIPFFGTGTYELVECASVISRITSATGGSVLDWGKFFVAVTNPQGISLISSKGALEAACKGGINLSKVSPNVKGTVCKSDLEWLEKKVHRFLLSRNEADIINWTTTVSVGGKTVVLCIKSMDTMEIKVGKNPPYTAEISLYFYAAIEALYIATLP